MAAVHIPQRTREGVQAPPHAGFRLPNPFGRKIFSENQKKKKCLRWSTEFGKVELVDGGFSGDGHVAIEEAPRTYHPFYDKRKKQRRVVILRH